MNSCRLHTITLDLSNLFPPFTHAKICIGVTPSRLCVCVLKNNQKYVLIYCSARRDSWDSRPAKMTWALHAEDFVSFFGQIYSEVWIVRPRSLSSTPRLAGTNCLNAHTKICWSAPIPLWTRDDPLQSRARRFPEWNLKNKTSWGDTVSKKRENPLLLVLYCRAPHKTHVDCLTTVSWLRRIYDHPASAPAQPTRRGGGRDKRTCSELILRFGLRNYGLTNIYFRTDVLSSLAML